MDNVKPANSIKPANCYHFGGRAAAFGKIYHFHRQWVFSTVFCKNLHIWLAPKFLPQKKNNSKNRV